MKKLFFIVLLLINSFAEESKTELESMFESRSFLIAKSTTSYEEAKKFSKEISKALNIRIDYRGLSFHKTEFLSFSKKVCEESWGKGSYPCFVPRGRFDDGKYISIEHHNQHAPKIIIICYRDVSKQVDFHYPSGIFKPI